MEDGFGNAGDAEQILSRAKLRLSARLAKGDVPHHLRRLLVESDFAGAETSAEQAREAFSGLDFMDHIMELLEEFEASALNAKEEGKPPHEVLANMHMIFHGPPGTGQ